MEGNLPDIVELFVEPASEKKVEYLDHDPDGFVEPPEDPGGFDDDDLVRGYEAES
jgi:hypothetical protein